MATFIVRVEMHDAHALHYISLHRRMRDVGFRTEVYGADTNGNPGEWQLPTAEYMIDEDTTPSNLRARVSAIAQSVKAGSWVLVTQVADQAWDMKLLPWPS